MKSSWSLSESLGKWVNKEKDEFLYRHVDIVEWPLNTGCARIPKPRFDRKFLRG